MEQATKAGNVIIVMGVSGSGKTTVGKLLAARLNLPFHDADDFHSSTNVAKMDQGIPLTDDDRQSWLAALAICLAEWETTGGAVLACSALKEAYRQTLQHLMSRPIEWVLLDGSPELIRERLLTRKGHYMSAALLDSQFADLEKPTYGLCLPIATEANELVEQIVAQLPAV